MFADNVDFSGNDAEVEGKVTTDGELLIGSTAAPKIRVGNLTSPGGSITIGYSSPDITLDVSGGGTAIEQVTVDNSTVPGTNPVLPLAGNITITGGQVVNASLANVIQTHSLAANSFAIQIQRAAASALANTTQNGVSHYASADFAVAATGFVTLSSTGAGKTITGDSGGALSPTANNWNIFGLSGSKTSGSGSTLTVKSPPYSSVGASATSSLNTGEFVTAAVTRTLPASAGLADGDLIEFVCTTAGALVIQAVGAQQIRIGNQISSVAGTATSNAQGDSLSIRFRAADGFWYATSVIGTFTLA